MNIEIKKATENTIENIYFLGKNILPIYYEQYEIKFMVSSKNHRIFIAFYDNKCVGYIIGKITFDKIHILSFGVDMTMRRLGIGTKLIDKIKKEFKFITLYVHVDNKSGIKFYEKNSFKVLEKLVDYYKGALRNAESYDALLMEFKNSFII